MSTSQNAGLPEADLLNAMSTAGFEDAAIVQKHDIFADVPNPSSAMEFGTVGISLRARKTGGVKNL